VEAIGNALAAMPSDAVPWTEGARAVDADADPAAAWALRGVRDAAPRLRARMDDPRRAVATNAAAALSTLLRRPQPPAVPALETLCARWRRIDDDGLRGNAAAVIILAGAPCAGAVAEHAARADASPVVRVAVASAIAAGVGGDTVRRALSRCVAGDPSPAVAARCAALRDREGLAPRDDVDARALDGDGSPLVGARVRLTLADGLVVWTETGPDGWVRVRDVSAGPFTLER
jgi:hypothetical protein